MLCVFTTNLAAVFFLEKTRSRRNVLGGVARNCEKNSSRTFLKHQIIRQKAPVIKEIFFFISLNGKIISIG